MRSKQILFRIEEYEKKLYYLADSTSDALFYASPKSGLESDLPMTSGMRHPPEHPETTSKSVTSILSKCRVFFFSILLLLITVAISFYFDLYLREVVAAAFPIFFMLLIYIYSAVKS